MPLSVRFEIIDERVYNVTSLFSITSRSRLFVSLKLNEIPRRLGRSVPVVSPFAWCEENT